MIGYEAAITADFLLPQFTALPIICCRKPSLCSNEKYVKRCLSDF